MNEIKSGAPMVSPELRFKEWMEEVRKIVESHGGTVEFDLSNYMFPGMYVDVAPEKTHAVAEEISELAARMGVPVI